MDTGGGNDFLFGGGGNDTMRGGAGTDTAVYLDSNPSDYDIRNQADGSWIVRDVRGAKTEGNDTLQNIEKLQFDKTQLFDLTRGGLTFESDLVFVIDTTGSMGSYIDGVKAQIKTIIAALFANGKTDARIAIESFKDTTNGEPSKTILKFTDQDSFADRQTAAINAINSLSTGGGGDIPETDNDGLIHALNGDVGLWRSGAASKRIILFTDAPVKDTELEAQVAALTASPASDGPAATGGRAPIANAMGATGLQSAPLNDVAAQGRSNDPSNHDPDASPPPAFVDKVDPITGSKGSTPSTLFAIQVGTDSTATDSLKTLATTTGGNYLDAPTPADLVKSILAVVALPPPPPPPPVAANFSVTNTTTGVTTIAPGAAYSGPVAGLAFQYIYTGPDNTNVTGQVPNCFIHTGSGFDAIDVSKVGGTNVLDGGTNSNFLVGGKDASGSDTFFVDDRSPPSDIWSTVGNFHAGDSATVFGITQSGFATDFVDGEGAVGYTGVTLHVTAPGIPTASLTLAGYSVADLSNGRLTTSFGMEGDGTPYFFIHANS